MKAHAYVPTNGAPYLYYQYRVLSYDAVRSKEGEWFDRLEVRVNDIVLPDIFGYSLGNQNPYGDPDHAGLSCQSLYDSGWQEGKIDLSSYRGSLARLEFFNENHKDGYWNTYSYLDNIQIVVE